MERIIALISFGLIAAFALFGMLGEENSDKHRDYTISFCILVAAITAIIIF